MLLNYEQSITNLNIRVTNLVDNFKKKKRFVLETVLLTGLLYLKELVLNILSIV